MDCHVVSELDCISFLHEHPHSSNDKNTWSSTTAITDQPEKTHHLIQNEFRYSSQYRAVSDPKSTLDPGLVGLVGEI